MNIALLSEYLDTYNGRDKILRLLSYVAKLATVATTSKDSTTKFKIFSSQMSSCRVMLRLLDDIPMIHYAMTYGWGEKERDWLIRCVELIQIAVDIVYCPIEHICWAGEHRIISIDVNAWDNTTIWFWILSLHLSLIKSLRKLLQFGEYKKYLSRTSHETETMLKTIKDQQCNELFTFVRLLLDVSYAVSYLPPGILWGGRLKPWHVGALGTVSSFIGLYQSLKKHAAQKKYP